jgi:hypothetical protein
MEFESRFSTKESIKIGRTIHSNGWRDYYKLEEKGYKHKFTVVQKSKQSASELLNRFI